MIDERTRANAPREPGPGFRDEVIDLDAMLTAIGDQAASKWEGIAAHADVVRKFDTGQIQLPDLSREITAANNDRYKRSMESIRWSPPPFVHRAWLRDHKLEAAQEANERLEEMARLLTESQEAQRLQAEEHGRKMADQVAREERALTVAEKALAESREQRTITAKALAEARKQRFWTIVIGVGRLDRGCRGAADRRVMTMWAFILDKGIALCRKSHEKW
jgi:hypothetical protein